MACASVLAASITACNSSTKTFTYVGSVDRVAPKSAVIVKVRIIEAPAVLHEPIAKPPIVKSRIIQGTVPGSEKLEFIRIRLPRNGMESVLNKDSVLTLYFAPDGSLLAIKELPALPNTVTPEMIRLGQHGDIITNSR